MPRETKNKNERGIIHVLLSGIKRLVIRLGNYPLILIGVLLLVLLVLSFGVVGSVLDNIQQESQLASLKSEHEKQIVQLTQEQNQLNDIIKSQQDELQALKDREVALYAEIDDLGAQLSNQERAKAALEEFIIKNNGSMDINEDERASTRFMPKQVIAMLDTLIEAISTGDKELYLSTVSSSGEYMLYPFENRKNTVYTITAFHPDGESDIGRLQSGGYYVSITLTDDKGNEDSIPAVGVTRDYHTGQWVIYDFD